MRQLPWVPPMASPRASPVPGLDVCLLHRLWSPSWAGLRLCSPPALCTISGALALYKYLLIEEAKRHIQSVRPYLYQETAFLCTAWRPDPSLSREFQEKSQGYWRRSFPRVQEEPLPLSRAVLSPALSTSIPRVFRCLAMPKDTQPKPCSALRRARSP